MNKNVILFAFVTMLALVACGPAAEDRKVMHEKAKIFQDSIANLIRTTIAEAEAPAPVAAPVATAASTATAAPASAPNGK